MEPVRGCAIVRDVGALNAVGHIVAELRSAGHTVDLFVEEDGASVKRVTGFHSPYMFVGHSFDVEAYFQEAQPRFLIAGLSQPRVLESTFEHAARAAKPCIPVMHVEDFWGGHVRAKGFQADIVVTIDDLGVKLLRQTYPSVCAVIAGFAGVTKVAPPDRLIERMERLRYLAPGVHVVIYPDGGPECDPALPNLVQSLLMTRERIAFVPRLHPRFQGRQVSENSSVTWGKWCSEKIKPLRERGLLHHFDATTDEIVEAALMTGSTCVASCYSSTMFRASNVGACPLTLWTPVIEAQLKNGTGLSKTPLMLYDAGYPVLREPRALDEFLGKSYARTSVTPFDARGGVNAVLALL